MLLQILVPSFQVNLLPRGKSHASLRPLLPLPCFLRHALQDSSGQAKEGNEKPGNQIGHMHAIYFVGIHLLRPVRQINFSDMGIVKRRGVVSGGQEDKPPLNTARA